MTRHTSDRFRARWTAFLPALAGLTLISACGIQFPSASNTAGTSALTADQSAPAVPGTATANASDEATRAIEEADILKVQNGFVYALNQYKGLFIIDVSNPDSPAIAGKLAFSGTPVEMYVEGSRAYIVASSYYAGPNVYATGGAAGDAIASPTVPYVPAFDGSKIKVVDISDPTNPKSMGDINLVGYATASRRIGDVIYVIGNDVNSTPIPVDVPPGGPIPAVAPINDPSGIYYPEQKTFVASINVADANNIQAVERKTFDGSGVNLAVSQTALYVTSTDYNSGTNGNYEGTTDIQYVDISDPTGKIKIRGTVTAPGIINNRFFLDEYQSVLRIATQSVGFGFQKVRVFTYDVSDPDNIQPLGMAQIIQGESLQAVAFDGPRGYLVTYLSKDPLFVVDLSDPANPAATGQLDVPGYSTHIDPRGTQLIAVGIDDTNGSRPAVALYDVSDVKNPKQVSRIVVGPEGQYVNSQATYDEKAYKIVDELGLIAIPFTYYKPVDANTSSASSNSASASLDIAVAPYYPPTQCVNAVQLIDYSSNGLTQRGVFEHRGSVERVGAIGSRAYALSELGFQTVNIDDRDHPMTLGFVGFFAADEASYFDYCNSIYPVDYFPIGSFIDPIGLIQALSDFLNSNGNCGTITPVPLAGLMGFAGFVGVRRVRRIRVRRTTQRHS